MFFLSIIGIGCGGIYIFHNIFAEIMPFSFANKLKYFGFFFFAYYGLLTFGLVWCGVLCSIFLNINNLVSLDFKAFLCAFLFVCCLVCTFVVFVIEAVHYQFMLSPYWGSEYGVLSIISRYFLYLFMVCFYVVFVSLVSLSLVFFMKTYLFKFLIITFFSSLSLIWLLTFSRHVLHQQSLFV